MTVDHYSPVSLDTREAQHHNPLTRVGSYSGFAGFFITRGIFLTIAKPDIPPLHVHVLRHGDDSHQRVRVFEYVDAPVWSSADDKRRNDQQFAATVALRVCQTEPVDQAVRFSGGNLEFRFPRVAFWRDGELACEPCVVKDKGDHLIVTGFAAEFPDVHCGGGVVFDADCKPLGMVYHRHRNKAYAIKLAAPIPSALLKGVLAGLSWLR